MANSPSNESILLKGALTPTLFVGVAALCVASFVEGRAGLFGALLAQIVVLIYFILHLVVSKISTNFDPVTTMSLAMFSYFAKFLALGGFLWLLGRFTNESQVDRQSFGISAVALTFAWMGGEIASYLRLKTHLPLPHDPHEPRS